ncbi:MAG TPA: lipid A export permease/ATP-binding protein MsbA [Gammaproteobacteria bacterium]|nr:lipid A export permease/ATP-binding protein MsbA [Gammaproteobacteria bacterium]
MTSSPKQLYARLLNYVRPHWRVFAACLGSMVIYAATDPVLPALLKPFLDGSFLTKPSGRAYLFPVLIVILFVVRGALNYVSTVSLNWVALRVMTDLRDDMFHNLVRLPARFYDGSRAGELLSRLTYDVAQVQQSVTRVLMVGVKDSLSIAALLAYMTYIHWRLTLVVALLGPLIAYVVRRISLRLREMSRRVQRSMGDIAHVAEETIKAHKIIRVYGGQDYEINRFQQAGNAARKYGMKVVMAAAANEPVVLFIISCGIAVMVYAAMLLSASKLMSTGEFVSFFTAMTLLQAPVRRVVGVNESLQRGLAASESIFALMDESPEPDHGSRTLERPRGEIRYEHVSFAYDDTLESALRDVTLIIAPGETVAIVGASGSGKTTLAALLPRFYLPQQGTVCIDGVDVREFTLASLRAQIALVSQDVVLFNDTIRNNIAYGVLRGTGEQTIVRAAEAARVMEFVRPLPQGLDTLIGENGMRLSGGQRQRLAIARALLKDAPILILDEATSALDTASERHIQEALETLRRGRTCLIIAHRLSTIENADRIVVLSEGCVVEAGTHAALLRRGGVYARLHQMQAIETLQPANGDQTGAVVNR